MEQANVPDDTHPLVHRRQIEGLRAMTPAQRLQRTFALCASADELAFAGMLLRDPHLTDTQRRRQLAVMRYGEEMVRRVEAYRACRHADR